MSLPLHPDAVSRMFMLAAMQNRRKADPESVDADMEAADSENGDVETDTDASQTDRPFNS